MLGLFVYGRTQEKERRKRTAYSVIYIPESPVAETPLSLAIPPRSSILACLHYRRSGGNLWRPQGRPSPTGGERGELAHSSAWPMSLEVRDEGGDEALECALSLRHKH